MSEFGKAFDAAQWFHDNMESPEEPEECEICIFNKYGECRADGETDETGDCPSFKD